MNVFYLLRPYWPWLLLAMGVALVPALAQAFFPIYVVKPLFDQILAKGEFDRLAGVLGLALGLLILVSLGGYLQELCIGYLSVRLPRDLRGRLHHHLLEADLAHLEASAGATTGRVIADLKEFETFIFFGLGILLVQGLSLLAILAQMFVHYSQLTWYLLATLPLLGIALAWVARWVTHTSNQTQAAAERLAGRMAESFARVELIRALGLGSFAEKRLEGSNQRHYLFSLVRVRISAISLPLSQLATALILVLLLFLGVGQVRSGIISSGDLTAFLTLLALAITPMQMLSRSGVLLAQAEGAAVRVRELLEIPSAPSGGTLRPADIKGQVEFRSLEFAYPSGEAVLRGLELSLLPGTLTALVGPSGAGKSSVLRLILGLYHPQRGQVLLDHQPLEDYAPDFLRSRVAWVPQEPSLFGGSVLENLQAFAPQASEAGMKAALERVRLFEELPNGLQTLLAEEGVGLSVGQRQRLVIAAALLREARVLLMDEVTSALDAESETKVLAAIEAARAGCTVLVVAHRLSTVQHADQIIVLERGRVAEQGKHADLLATKGLYARLWGFRGDEQ